MPVELKLLMWLPAIPVKTRSILQSAISSASSSVRWMAFTVASMLTTTPFFRPLDSWPPMPTMSMRPSGKSSATIATTFEVPMSRATMRFLFSFAMSDPRVRRFQGLRLRSLRDVEREAVGVAQIHIVHTLSGFAERLWEYRHEPGETHLDRLLVQVASELHGKAVRELELPGQARAQQDLPRCETQRREQIAEYEVAVRNLALAARRPDQNGQRGVALPAEKLSMSVDQLGVPSLAPAGQHRLLLEAHFQAVGPAAAQFGAAYPWNALEERADRFQVHGEERALYPSLERVDDVAAL